MVLTLFPNEAPRSLFLCYACVVAPSLRVALVRLYSGSATTLAVCSVDADTRRVSFPETDRSHVFFVVIVAATSVDALVIRYSVPSAVNELLVWYCITRVRREEASRSVLDAIVEATRSFVALRRCNSAPAAVHSFRGVNCLAGGASHFAVCASPVRLATTFVTGTKLDAGTSIETRVSFGAYIDVCSAICACPSRYARTCKLVIVAGAAGSSILARFRLTRIDNSSLAENFDFTHGQ